MNSRSRSRSRRSGPGRLPISTCRLTGVSSMSARAAAAMTTSVELKGKAPRDVTSSRDR
ncbi:hypothetical protein OG302_41170 [Streptomyces sp. NBC_01283]|uniref:hypothetical protein n=1 Tax=Streptomyces sp. NBC_01283 TaxID=2903812 RepID=UPI00352EC331|nr:hypothetical protein OG302_41170 [Streptomyces sp. NBC_01283]